MSGCRNRLAYHLEGKTIKCLISSIFHYQNTFGLVGKTTITVKVAMKIWHPILMIENNGFLPFGLFANTHMNCPF